MKTELATKSLADIAKAKGIDIVKVTDALVAEFKAHLDEEVASGEHTQVEADAKLAEFKTRVTDMVNNVRPAHGPEGRGQEGRGPRGQEGRGHRGHGGPGMGHGPDDGDDAGTAASASPATAAIVKKNTKKHERKTCFFLLLSISKCLFLILYLQVN